MTPLVSVIAGGPSAGSVAHPPVAPGFVIGVNDAGVHARCDAVLSMDRLWAEHRWAWLARRAGPTWLRRSAVQNITARPDWLAVFECDHTSSEMTLEAGHLNGTNSGLVALNLAVQMQPRRIELFGFDMAADAGRAHWFPDYPWAPRGATGKGKFEQWAGELQAAIGSLRDRGLDVVLH